MPWYGKEQAIPEVDGVREGLTFLDGDLLAQMYRQSWIAATKYPLIEFPSGFQRELMVAEAREEERVHLFGGLYLPVHTTRGEAYQSIKARAEKHGYAIEFHGERHLTVSNPQAGYRYRATYDNTRRKIIDVARLGAEEELLSDDMRAILPPLHHREEIELDSVATIKFATADQQKAWYAAEFDQSDRFYGIIAGESDEVGHFSLSELEGYHQSTGQHVQRDLEYQPMTLREIQQVLDAERASYGDKANLSAQNMTEYPFTLYSADSRTLEEFESEQLLAAQALTTPLFEEPSITLDESTQPITTTGQSIVEENDKVVVSASEPTASSNGLGNSSENGELACIAQQGDVLIEADGHNNPAAVLGLIALALNAYDAGIGRQAIYESVQAAMQPNQNQLRNHSTQNFVPDFREWHTIYQAEEYWDSRHDRSSKATAKSRKRSKNLA